MTTLEEWDRLIIRSQANTAFLQAMRAEQKIRDLLGVPFPDHDLIEGYKKVHQENVKQHRALCEQVGTTPNI